MAVRVQDLPYLADEATCTLVRQQIRAINECQTVCKGATIRFVLDEKARQGQWVGWMLSQWGLRYAPPPKIWPSTWTRRLGSC